MREKKKQQSGEESPGKELADSLVIMLGSTENRDVQPYSIPFVPGKLRKSNEDAYRPRLVSVGPMHRGRTELLYMEEAKLRCMLSLFRRTEYEIKALEMCSKTFLSFDDVSRASYVSEIKLSSVDLAKILLVDCSFILELLISNSEEMSAKLPHRPLDTNTISQAAKLGKDEIVLSDLLMIENQVPFPMLKKLWKKLFPHLISRSNSETELVKMALSFFGCTGNDSLGPGFAGVCHLLQLVHSSITPAKVIECETMKDNVQLMRCATKLQAAGVKIRTPYHKLDKRSSSPVTNRTSSNLEGSPSETEPLNRIFMEFDFEIQFDKDAGILEIPPLHITRATESKWRSFIAWEQNNTRWTNKKEAPNCTFTSHASFFRGLICSVHDIQLLREKKVIIVDDLKLSNRDLLTLFNTITEGVDHMDSRFSVCCDELNKYSKADPLTKSTLIMWHRFRRTLTDILEVIPTGKYLISFAVVSSVLALLLTIAQTVLAVLSLK